MFKFIKPILITFFINWCTVIVYRLFFGDSFIMTRGECDIFPGNCLNPIFKWIPGVVAFLFIHKESITIRYFKTPPMVALEAALLGVSIPIISFLLSVPFTSLNLPSFSFQNIVFLFVYTTPCNILFALGEEIMWRGYFMVKITHLSFLHQSLISGCVWGLWHLPLIVIGYDYPGHPYLGIYLMLMLTIGISPMFIFLRLKGGSLLAPTLLHGIFNTCSVFLVQFFEQPSLLLGSFGFIGTLVIAICFIMWMQKLNKFKLIHNSY